MLSKKVLKDIQSLGLKKRREETGLFVAEGPKIVEELMQVVPEKNRSHICYQKLDKQSQRRY